MPYRNLAIVVTIVFAPCLCAYAALLPRVEQSSQGSAVSIYDGEQPAFTPIDSGVRVVQPSGAATIAFKDSAEADGTLTLTNGAADGLTLTDAYRIVSPDLIERTTTVTASSDRRYYIDFGWTCAVEGTFYSFMGPEAKTAAYTPSCAGSEFGVDAKQTFPFMGCLAGERLYGVIGETAGLWENRQFMNFDVEKRQLSLCNGDGSAKRVVMIPRNIDATSVYRATFDGWQHIEIGEMQTFKTWIFASPAKSLYDVQLAAHLALANAKGFNHSSLEAILRNTSYMLLRRNLLRPESDYIFISGTGYGWKQWVSDGFWMSRGLDDPKYDAEAQAAVFFERVNYEDNAQYYLIWAALVKRTGGNPDERTVGRAYRFIREYEKDGLYIPPRLHPDKLCYKTYHDQLPYEDGDAPSSNQGFHCGALMAAKELGFEVSDAEIDKAIEGYKRMFSAEGGYMATSLQQQGHVGQDALYGEVLTYCVFGKKLLPDEMVRTHLETTMRIQSPYGMRVISNADGSLLEGHEGVYTNGGSWFLNDGANYLDGLIHGMDPQWIDDKIMWRLEKELAFMPAFHESISTVHGKPHGHHLYSWNSGFWWLRKEVRDRLGMTGPDPLDARLDAALGVKSVNGALVLDPGSATLRPKD
ncbi:MAG: hypothetical protein WC655_01940 [Candidatus Hydrogenedentales bacterium]|jgi:hypothetical protein